MSEDDPTRKAKATLNSITADAMMGKLKRSNGRLNIL